MNDEEATLEGQFSEFARLFDPKNRNGATMTLYRSDYWMRQANILDDRALTMTDTGMAWFEYAQTELNLVEWYEFLTDLCTKKGFDQERVEFELTNCGSPGSKTVDVPQYRTFFATYKPKEKMIV